MGARWDVTASLAALHWILGFFLVNYVFLAVDYRATSKRENDIVFLIITLVGLFSSCARLSAAYFGGLSCYEYASALSFLLPRFSLARFYKPPHESARLILCVTRRNCVLQNGQDFSSNFLSTLSLNNLSLLDKPRKAGIFIYIVHVVYQLMSDGRVPGPAFQDDCLFCTAQMETC